MAKPKRTFTGQEGQRSVGTAGPDAIRHDLDNLFAALDPDDTFKDGSQGGISLSNLQAILLDDTHEPSDSFGTIDILLSGIANVLKRITGKSYWYQGPDMALSETASRTYVDNRITEVDVVGDVSGHILATNVHSATSAATPERLVMRDAYGRAKVAKPNAPDDIARKDTVEEAVAAVPRAKITVSLTEPSSPQNGDVWVVG